MSENEAIKFLTGFKDDNNFGGCVPEVLNMAITALENQVNIAVPMSQ